MKRFYILAILAMMTAASAVAQISDFFERYTDVKGISSVYISKAMLQMIPEIETGGLEIKSLIGQLDCIRVLSTEKPEVAAKLATDFKKFLTNEKMDILMSANDDGSKATIYMKTLSNGCNQYLIVAQEQREMSIVLIEGKITPTAISNVTKKKIKNIYGDN